MTENPKRGRGRPTGSRNKNLTQSDIANAFRKCFIDLGGPEWLLEQAQKYPVEFIRAFQKFIPQEHNIDGETDLNITIQRIDYRQVPLVDITPKPAQLPDQTETREPNTQTTIEKVDYEKKERPTD